MAKKRKCDFRDCFFELAVPHGGGSFPVWSRNALELFYVAADHLMVTSYRSDRASFTAEKPLAIAPAR
jgi:hypothetical protein